MAGIEMKGAKKALEHFAKRGKIDLRICLNDWGSVISWQGEMRKTDHYEQFFAKIGDIIEGQDFERSTKNFEKFEQGRETTWIVPNLSVKKALDLGERAYTMIDPQDQTPAVSFLTTKFDLNFCNEDHLHIYMKESKEKSKRTLKKLKGLGVEADFENYVTYAEDFEGEKDE